MSWTRFSEKKGINMEKKDKLEIIASPSRICIVWYEGWEGGYRGHMIEAITRKRVDGVVTSRCGSVFEAYISLVDIFNELYG